MPVCDNTKIIYRLHDIPPPENVKNRDFPQLQYAVKFFWGEISIHNKNIKCQFRLELSKARNHMLTANLEKKLEG